MGTPFPMESSKYHDLTLALITYIHSTIGQESMAQRQEKWREEALDNLDKVVRGIIEKNPRGTQKV